VSLFYFKKIAVYTFSTLISTAIFVIIYLFANLKTKDTEGMNFIWLVVNVFTYIIIECALIFYLITSIIKIRFE